MMMSRSYVLIVASFLTTLVRGQYTVPAFANFSGPTGPLIDLGYIKVQGTQMISSQVPINAWLGIRFAQPPIGSLRFNAPLPIENSPFLNKSEIFNGTTYGSVCYQGVPIDKEPDILLGTFGNRLESEDCLLLDIYAPPQPRSKSLPVLFYIHGGGYVVGDSSQVPVDSLMSIAAGGVVVVQIQYRLAGWGFLGGSEVSTKGAQNAGLMDQRLALQWVQQHISSFGGDPNHIVIQGGSAGGGSVGYHLIWEGGVSNPPFQGAIAELPWMQAGLNVTQRERQYRQVLAAANCDDLACLQSLLPAKYNNVQLAVTNLTTQYPFGYFYFAPYVDGKYIQDLPSREFAAGHFSVVPLISTRDGNEGYLFTRQNITTEADYEARVNELFSSAGRSFLGLLNSYLPSNATGPYAYVNQQQRAEWLAGDAVVACASYYLASSFVDAFAPITSDFPVWKFIWAYPTYAEAYHGSYPSYVTSTAASGSAITAQFSRMIQAWFISFIQNLDPNVGVNGNPQAFVWPKYSGDANILFLNATGNSPTPNIIRDIDASGICDFLQGHAPSIGI